MEFKEGPYPGYVVTRQGKIYSHRSKKYLTPYKNKKGYYYVDLDAKPWPVAHVVWFAFNGYRPGRVKFIDGDPGNFALGNLKEFGNKITAIKED